mmetsp:Transcript_25379/g.45106  ORF Transcript_25379/g.45106 Transcript_25379/m.45106 type:complete len:241 (+) Transcript_25379:204-926(+)
MTTHTCTRKHTHITVDRKTNTYKHTQTRTGNRRANNSTITTGVSTHTIATTINTATTGTPKHTAFTRLRTTERRIPAARPAHRASHRSCAHASAMLLVQAVVCLLLAALPGVAAAAATPSSASLSSKELGHEARIRSSCVKISTCHSCRHFINTNSSCAGLFLELNCTETAANGTVLRVHRKLEKCEQQLSDTEPDDGLSFWYFEIVMTLMLAASVYITMQRKKRIQKLREGKMSRFVTS